MTEPQYTEPIEIDDDNDPGIVEVEETEVTEANFESFLPDYTDTTPGINTLLDEDGKLLPDAQAAWDQPPPDPQDGYEEGEGI